MAETEKSIVQQYNEKLGFLEEERSEWDTHCQDITEFLLPRHGLYLVKGDLPNRGIKKHSKIINGVGTRALRVCAAGMQGGLTSPARPWFRLGLDDKELAEFGDVKNWLYSVEKLMYALFSRSNFYDSIHSAYTEEIGFGTACIFEEEDPLHLIRFKVMTFGEYSLALAQNGQVDTVMRRYWSTARQMAQRFGRDKLSRQAKQAVEEGNPYDWFQMCHAIEPREEYDPGKKDAQNMPFKSIYWEYNTNEDTELLRESGYVEFPAFTPRWLTTGSDIYGRSPGMDVLGDVKMLQEMEKASIKAIHKQVDPPVQVPSTKSKKLDGLPGGVNYVEGQNPITPLYDINFRIDHAEGKIDRVALAIREGMYNDLFLMLLERPNMTATEVAERHEEKLLMLGPVIERQFHELLDPIIDRTFGIMERNGMIPTPPDAIQGMPLRVEYVSLLAQAQKMVATQSLQAGLGFVGQLAAAKEDPAVWDKIDTDQAIDEFASAVGMPPTVVRPDDAVAELRKRRAKLQEQQRLQEQQEREAATMKELSETDTEGDNALTRLNKTIGGVY